MTTILVYLVVLTALTPPVGAYMYRVYTSEHVGRVEGVIYRLIRRRLGRHAPTCRRGTCRHRPVA